MRNVKPRRMDFDPRLERPPLMRRVFWSVVLAAVVGALLYAWARFAVAAANDLELQSGPTLGDVGFGLALALVVCVGGFLVMEIAFALSDLARSLYERIRR